MTKFSSGSEASSTALAQIEANFQTVDTTAPPSSYFQWIYEKAIIQQALAASSSAGTVVLGVFKATSAGTGYSLNDILILRQTPPSAAEYYNATTGAVIGTPNPAHLGPIGSASNVSVTNTPAVSQSGLWTFDRVWALGSGTDSVAIGGTLPSFATTQSFNIANSIPAGSNVIGAIANTTFAATQSGIWNIGNIPSSLGAKTAANSLAVTLATDGVASGIANQIGEVQASPTANTVLARLKVIADALVFGIKSAANSISITPASDATFTLASEAGFITVRNTALTNTAVAIKASAGSLMGWNFINVNTSAVYVKFYDVAAASVVVGTTPVKATIAIPAGSATNPAIFLQSPDIVPFEVFTTAMSFACVTGLADNSTTAPATAIHASVRYK